MSSVHPDELLDIQKTHQAMVSTYDSWLSGTCNDKRYSVLMQILLEELQKEVNSLKNMYRRGEDI